LPFGYSTLSANASEVDRKASKLLQDSSIETSYALRLVGDYQPKRAAGPPLPDWLWRLRRKDLNEIWNSTRGSRGDSAITPHRAPDIPGSLGTS